MSEFDKLSGREKNAVGWKAEQNYEESMAAESLESLKKDLGSDISKVLPAVLNEAAESYRRIMESINPQLRENFINAAKEKIAGDPAAVQEALVEYTERLRVLHNTGQTIAGIVKGERTDRGGSSRG
jgi:hypothetical protein